MNRSIVVELAQYFNTQYANFDSSWSTTVSHRSESHSIVFIMMCALKSPFIVFPFGVVHRPIWIWIHPRYLWQITHRARMPCHSFSLALRRTPLFIARAHSSEWDRDRDREWWAWALPPTKSFSLRFSWPCGTVARRSNCCRCSTHRFPPCNWCLFWQRRRQCGLRPMCVCVCVCVWRWESFMRMPSNE